VGPAGTVDWEPGQLVLKDGAKLTQDLEGETWFELELDLQFSNLNEDGQKSRLEVLLDRRPATDSFLRISQSRQNGKTSSEIALYETPEQGSNEFTKAFPRKIRSQTIDRDLPSGLWQIKYYGGVWAIRAPMDSPKLFGYVDFSRSKINVLHVSTHGQSCRCSNVKIHRVPRVQFPSNQEETKELASAKLLSERLRALHDQQRGPEALKIGEAALAINHRLLGTYHPDVLAVQNNLARAYQLMELPNEAQMTFEETLRIWKCLYPEDHPGLAMSLNNLAVLQDSMGQTMKAEALYVESLAMRQRLYAVDVSEVAVSLNNIAVVRMALGRMSDAESALEQAVKIDRRLFRRDHPNLANSLHNLASLRQRQGRLLEAESLFEEALAMRQRLSPEGNSDVANSLNNLAVLRRSMGKLTEAEPLVEQSLLIYRRTFEGDNPYVAATLNNLASLRLSLGRADEANALHEECLAITKRLYPMDHPAVAEVLTKLSISHSMLGRDAEAESLCEQGLLMLQRMFPGDHPDVAKCQRTLASLKMKLGSTMQAEQLFESSLAMNKRLYIGDHYEVASSLNHFAYFRLSQGQFSEAEPLYEQSLAMIERMRTTVRDEVLERAAYSETLNLLTTARRYATVLVSSEKVREAISVFERGSNRIGLDLFAGGRIEAEKVFRATATSEDLARYEAAVKSEVEARASLLEAEIRFGLSPEDEKADWSKKLTNAREELSNATADVFDELRGLVPQLNPMKADELLAALHDGQGLLIWVWNTSGPVLLVAGNDDVQALKLATDVAETTRLTESVTRLRTWISVQPNATVDDGPAIIQAARDGLLPADARTAISRYKSLIAVPDGPIHGVPLELLVPDLPISYAPSATIALNRIKASTSRRESRTNAVVLGNPQFNHERSFDNDPPSAVSSTTAEERMDFSDGGFLTPLPGTGLEANSVAKLIDQGLVLLLGADATTPKLNAAIEAHPPRILHLATHGLMGTAERPLMASLALTTPTEPTPADTGFVTLKDILSTWGARLHGTELVVLSACNTARGVQQGDTSMALPLGMFVCGAETVIASQWKVDDTATALLMSRFYTNWLGKTEFEREVDGVTYPPGQSLSKLAALREAQSWLRGLTRDQVESITKSLADPATDGATAITQFTRGGDDELETPLDLEHPYAHPYYWSSFVLYGSPE
jgi:CHAT domain-containing protein